MTKNLIRKFDHNLVNYLRNINKLKKQKDVRSDDNFLAYKFINTERRQTQQTKQTFQEFILPEVTAFKTV